MRTLIYGVLAIPIAFLGLPLYIYLPTFYVSTVQLDVAMVGIVLFFARIIDMIADPFIGRLNDNHKKRKYMIVFGSVFLIFGFYFLTHPPSTSNTFYLFIFSTITYIAWSLMNIPYLALNAKLGKDYHDNSKLSFSRELFTILGVLIALLLPFLFEVSNNPQESLFLIFYSFCIVLPLVLFFFLIFIKEEDSISYTYKFFESIKKFYKDFNNAKSIFIAFILNNLANAIPATLFLFYVELVLRKPESTGILLITYFLSGVLALPFWINLSKKINKKNTWMISMALASFVFCFVPFLKEGDIFAFALISIISGMSLGADMAIPSSIQADIAQESQKMGNQVSGLLFGFWAMFTKLSLALAVAITFISLDLVGFDKTSPNETSLLTLTLLYSILPVCLKLIALSFVFSFKENKESIN